MSYSRWSDSDWYTFWHAAPPPDADPVFEMWHFAVERLYSAAFSQLDGISEEDLAKLVSRAPRAAVPELLEYVREFCEDVRKRNAEASSG